jgi:hypothetical protein
MTFEPEYLKRWTKPDHYAGASWPEYYSSGVGQSRDRDALERSNFTCMLRALGGESDTVIVVNEGHWAVGWVEWIAIHQDDDKALAIADKIKGDLEDYLVINEDHWSELEMEDANETWTNCFDDRERLAYIRKHRSQFEFYDYADLINCVRGRHFAGYASDLLC